MVWIFELQKIFLVTIELIYLISRTFFSNVSSNLFILLNLSIKTKQIMIACKNYKIINGENDDEIDVCVCEYDDENSPPSPRTPLVPLLSWEHSSGMNSDRLELFHPHYCWMELYSNNPEWDLASLDPQNSCRPNDPILHTIGIYTTIHYSYSSALGRHLTSNSISLAFHMSLYILYSHSIVHTSKWSGKFKSFPSFWDTRRIE